MAAWWEPNKEKRDKLVEEYNKKRAEEKKDEPDNKDKKPDKENKGKKKGK